MDSAAILDELLALLEAQDVIIRRDALGGGGGGLCNIKGKNIFFLDTQADMLESAAKCAQALAKVADIEKLYITPQVREIVEKYKTAT
jgi:hypothetical protein